MWLDAVPVELSLALLYCAQLLSSALQAFRLKPCILYVCRWKAESCLNSWRRPMTMIRTAASGGGASHACGAPCASGCRGRLTWGRPSLWLASRTAPWRWLSPPLKCWTPLMHARCDICPSNAGNLLWSQEMEFAPRVECSLQTGGSPGLTRLSLDQGIGLCWSCGTGSLLYSPNIQGLLVCFRSCLVRACCMKGSDARWRGCRVYVEFVNIILLLQ